MRVVAILLCHLAVLLAMTAPSLAAIVLLQPDGRTVLMHGDIVPGDYDRLKAVIDKMLAPVGGGTFYESGYNLDLLSNGGNFDEGIRIGTLLRQKGMGTRLTAGAQCYSACAVIFMHGAAWLDGELYINRKMDRASYLGFHAPYLRLAPDAVTTPELVDEAYAVALTQLADLMDSSQNVFSDELLRMMLRVPSDKLLSVRDYGQLLAWRIYLLGDDPPIRKVSLAQIEIACQTRHDLERNLHPSKSLDEAQKDVDAGFGPVLFATLRDKTAIYRYSLSDADEIGCNIGVLKQPDGTLTLSYYGATYGTERIPKNQQPEGMSYELFMPPEKSFSD